MGFPCLKKGVKEDGEEDEEHPYRPAEVDGEGGKGKGGEGTEAGCHDFHDLLHEGGEKDADEVYRDKKEEKGRNPKKRRILMNTSLSTISEFFNS